MLLMSTYCTKLTVMSERSIQTTADILRLTQEYDDRRHEALVRELGEKTLLSALEEEEIENEATKDLSDEETRRYFLMNPTGQTESAMARVEGARERYDETIFSQVTNEDKELRLQGFRIADIGPGKIILMDGRRSPYGQIRGDFFAITALVNPTDMALQLTKLFFKRWSGPKMVEVTDADATLIYTAARLLARLLTTNSDQTE